MNDLTPERERALEECLRELDVGAGPEAVLSRYPHDVNALRTFLEMRTSLFGMDRAIVPAGAMARGRATLLAEVEATPARAGVWAWTSSRAALGRGAALAAAIVVLALGVLGASAAGGFEPAQEALAPARDVLERFRIVPERGGDERDDAPSALPTDAPPTDVPAAVEPRRERERLTATPAPIRDVDPIRTPAPDARPTLAPVRDNPTATPVRDGPSRPVRPTATATLVRDVPDDRPVDVRPTAARPGDAPVDSRGGEPEPTPARQHDLDGTISTDEESRP